MKKNAIDGAKRKPKNPGIRELEPNQVFPLTPNQERAFDAWDRGSDLVLGGCAGTGKTHIAMHFAVTSAKRVYVVRSAVPTRNQGFMPGGPKEKASLYEGPYVRAVNSIFGRGDAYALLTQKGVIEFITTSYLRGLTLDDCVVVVDETQNMTFHELDTVMTRVGENCRVIFLGDSSQTDLTGDHDKSGSKRFFGILARVGCFERVSFGIDDIVRSGKVRDYIIARERHHEVQGPVQMAFEFS